MLKDLRDFLMRGNVVDLAVAVIIGIAFGAVVASFTDDILMQIISGIFGEPNFNDLTWEIGDVVIRYGRFLTALVNFLIIGTALFFIVRAVEQMMPKRDATATEVDLLTEIRDLLRDRPVR